MTASKAQIAVVEDDSALRELLVEELEAEDYKVFAFPSTEDYQAELPSVDVVVSDIRLPGSSGCFATVKRRGGMCLSALSESVAIIHNHDFGRARCLTHSNTHL